MGKWKNITPVYKLDVIGLFANIFRHDNGIKVMFKRAIFIFEIYTLKYLQMERHDIWNFFQNNLERTGGT